MTASDDVITLARLAGGLVVVLTLVYLSARVAKRGRLRRGDSGVRVLDRVALSREAHLAVVEIGGRTVLLGVTSQSVNLITGLDDEPQPAPAASAVTVVTTVAPEIIEDLEGELVDEIGVDVVRPTTSARPDPMPAGVTLDGYPDLASALRAAGRTSAAPAERMPIGPPRTRAEARRRDKALAEAEKALEEAEAAQIARAKEARETKEAKIPRPRTAEPARRATTAPQKAVPTQASGSVLSPRTWQQGIDALREYTVRRG